MISRQVARLGSQREEEPWGGAGTSRTAPSFKEASQLKASRSDFGCRCACFCQPPLQTPASPSLVLPWPPGPQPAPHSGLVPHLLLRCPALHSYQLCDLEQAAFPLWGLPALHGLTQVALRV